MRLFIMSALSFLCACNHAMPLGAASGIVTLHGMPMSTGTITFSRTDGSVTYICDIDASGHFRFEVAAGHGLPVGEYKVAISPYRPTKPSLEYVDPDMTERAYPNVPPRYQDPEKSGFTAKVEPGGHPDFRFDIP